MSARHLYQAYGLIIDSEVPLLSVPAAPQGAASVSLTIKQGSAEYFRAIDAPEPADPEDWVHHAVLPDGTVYLHAAEVFEATVCARGETVVCRQLGSLDVRTLEANLLNFVISTSLTLRGEEPLHATVVEIDGHAVGLLGHSGAGKSTMAAFAISRGGDLLTDDMLRVTFESGQALVHPGPYRLKLVGDASTRWLPDAVAKGHFNSLRGKIMVQPRESAPPRLGPMPLTALFHLADTTATSSPDVVTSRRLVGIELARTIISATMDTRYIRSQRLARQLAFAERLAAQLPVYELCYPRRIEALASAVDEISSRLPA